MVVRASELPPPRRVSDEDFDAICATSKIGRDEREHVRRHLDQIADEFAAKIRGERMRPDRQADRDRLRRIHKALQKARAELEYPMGDAAEFGLQSGAPLLALMITEHWFRVRLSGVKPTLEEILKDPSEVRREMRLRLDDFASQRPADLISAVLEEVEAVLMTARTFLPVLLPRSRGGRQPLTQRKYLIANLAICWNGLGRRPTSGPNSQFTAFCEAVFEPIGWPTDGVEAAVPDALAVWRNPPKKIVG
jgi:hypothetical protein